MDIVLHEHSIKSIRALYVTVPKEYSMLPNHLLDSVGCLQFLILIAREYVKTSKGREAFFTVSLG